MRRAEVSLLKVSDIDSRRMMIRVERGKGGAGRDIPLSPALLETLREYWRWKKPRNYLFPSQPGNRGPDSPISDKTVWYACKEAALYARIKKHVTPHTLRQASAYCTTFQSSFILKTIGLGRREFAEVYGRHDMPLSLLVAPPEATDLFSR